MKKITTALIILFALVLCGCQKNAQVQAPPAASGPTLEEMMTGFAQIMLNDEADCAKVSSDMAEYINANADTWRQLMTSEILRRVDAGESLEDAATASFQFTPEIEEALSDSKCLHDPDVRDSIHLYEREIPAKACDAAEAQVSAQ